MWEWKGYAPSQKSLDTNEAKPRTSTSVELAEKDLERARQAMLNNMGNLIRMGPAFGGPYGKDDGILSYRGGDYPKPGPAKAPAPEPVSVPPLKTKRKFRF